MYVDVYNIYIYISVAIWAQSVSVRQAVAAVEGKRFLCLNFQISYDSLDAAHVSTQLTHGALCLELSQQTRSGLTAI